MQMNVKPIPTISESINEIRSKTAAIVNEDILPNEKILWAWRGDGRYTEDDVKEAKRLRKRIQERVGEGGVWAPHLPKAYGAS